MGTARAPLLLARRQPPDLWHGGSASSAGWLRLSSVQYAGTAGEPAVALNKGACEDREWAVKGEYAYVSSNCSDLLGRGLARVRVSDGQRQSLVVGNPHVVAGMGSQSAGESGGGIALADSYIAWLESSATTPAAVKVLKYADIGLIGGGGGGGGGRRRSPIATTITDDKTSSPDWTAGPKLLTPKAVSFPSADGAFTLHAQLFEAPHQTGAGVVYTHGGSERQAFSAFHFSAVYAQQYAFNQYLALEAGLGVLSVNYRSGVGFGHEFRVCANCMGDGGAEYADVRTAALVGGRNASGGGGARGSS